MLHRELLAVDLDVDVAAGLVFFVVVSGRGCGAAGHAGEVQRALDPLGAVGHRGEVVVAKNGQVGGDGGGHTLDLHLVECSDHPSDGGGAILAPDAELAGQVVVVLADFVAGLVPAVPADAEARRYGELGDGTGGGEELALGGVLGVDPNLDGVAVDLDVVLGEGKLLTGGHAELELDEVVAGDEFGDGVLHLQPGVHLEVVEAAVLVEELHRAGVDVVTAPGDLHRRLTHVGEDLGGDAGCGGFLDQLLVAALSRAVACAEVDAVAVGVGDDLDLDVARIGQVPLHVALVAAEVGGCFALG